MIDLGNIITAGAALIGALAPTLGMMFRIERRLTRLETLIDQPHQAAPSRKVYPLRAKA